MKILKTSLFTSLLIISTSVAEQNWDGPVGINNEVTPFSSYILSTKGRVKFDSPDKSYSDNSYLYYGVGNGLSTYMSIGETGAFYVRAGEYANTEYRFCIKGESGNVGIGTVNPDEKLTVNGTIKAKEVKVTAKGWADYVFNDNYKLKSLAETKVFINKNKHLPNIPSAKEVEKNGIDVADMQVKMLEKIEELTLHCIALEEKVNRLTKEGR